MLMAVIVADNLYDVQCEIEKVQHQVDGFELRFDNSPSLTTDFLQALRQLSPLPMIFTLRSQSQGGSFQGSQVEYFQHVIELCQGQPDYIDLEWDSPKSCFEYIANHFPHIKIICSYHHFQGGTINFQALYRHLEDFPFAILKLAIFCHTSLEALALMHEMTFVAYTRPRTMIAMGSAGQFLRILGPIMGNAIDYAGHIAPGQLSVIDWVDIYHYHQLNSITRVYALLGTPVDKSLGHIFHNQKIREGQQNLVYVKIELEKGQLPEFLQQCLVLPFDGFSVTMPLKMDVARLLQTAQPAINTLKRGPQGWWGCNTDGLAVVDILALKHPQNILILGAGGAALGIAHALSEAFHTVRLFHHHVEKVKEFGFQAFDAKEQLDFDIMINTLPPNATMQVCINPKCILVDINYNQHSNFADAAKQLGCHCIDGYGIFIAQALLQRQFWFEYSLMP